MSHKTAFFFHGLLLFGCASLAPAQTRQTRPVKDLILPGESFLVEGRPAFIFWPPEDKRQKPQPWIMYAPTLPAYPDSHERFMHEQFLAAGVAVAGIDAGEAYGSPQGQKLMTALYEKLTLDHGFARKPCLLGRSRGGLWVSSWAIAHAEKTAGIAGIYPVFDLRTYPGLEKAAPAFGLTAPELESQLPQLNPIARVDVLAKAKVPVCIIHGDMDQIVPLTENSAALAQRYQHSGAADAVQLIVAEGQGHNFWEGFFRCRELIDFAIVRAKAGASASAATR
jgi:alpha-beta hydrolase superfamily lysophospholipase